MYVQFNNFRDITASSFEQVRQRFGGLSYLHI
jgi:hypothetical protein